MSPVRTPPGSRPSTRSWAGRSSRVGTPLERLVPTRPQPIGTALAAVQVPAWTVFGVGIGQAQILLIGCPVAVAVIVTYRLVDRGNRYVRT